MNKIETVELTITSLITDLMNGLQWLEKNNVGAGSIQDKYQATEMQILTIMKHPKLKDIEPIKVFFKIKDDTEEQSSNQTESKEEVNQMQAIVVTDNIEEEEEAIMP